MTNDFKSFTKTEIDEFSKIMRVENLDKNAMRIVHIHAFFDVRFDVIVSFLNENNPGFLLSFKTIYPKGDSVYLKEGVGFKIPHQLGFAAKLDQFSSLGMFRKETVATLRKLNQLRNACAHDFKRRITKRDVGELSSKLSSTSSLRELFEEKISSENLEERLCGCIFWIFLDVMMSLEKVEIWKSVLEDNFCR